MQNLLFIAYIWVYTNRIVLVEFVSYVTSRCHPVKTFHIFFLFENILYTIWRYSSSDYIHSFMFLDISVKMCNYTFFFSLIMDQISVDYFGFLLTVIG
jgi:hypothetical protein